MSAAQSIPATSSISEIASDVISDAISDVVETSLTSEAASRYDSERAR